MKKILFLMPFVLFISNIQTNSMDNKILNNSVQRYVVKQERAFGDIIEFEDVYINLSNYIGIGGDWYGSNHIVFDINDDFVKIGREYVSLILKDYNQNPYLEIAFFIITGN